MPSRPLLIFDGDCAFCTSCQQWAAVRVDHEALPWQFADLDALSLTQQQASQSIWLFDAGDVLSGADAASALLRRSHIFWWRFVGELMALPGVRELARPVYGWVAHNRHRFPGATPACETRPSPGR